MDVNEHWHKMKKIMMETAQHICGMSKGSCRHKETWWWNEEVAEAVREKKISTENGREKIRRRHGWNVGHGQAQEYVGLHTPVAWFHHEMK